MTGAEGAERSEAPRRPFILFKLAFQLPGAEGAERSEAPEAPLYPYQFSSFCLGVDAGIIFYLEYCHLSCFLPEFVLQYCFLCVFPLRV